MAFIRRIARTTTVYNQSRVLAQGPAPQMEKERLSAAATPQIATMP